MALSRKEVLKEFRRLEMAIDTQGSELAILGAERDIAIERAQEIAGAALDLRADEVQERIDYKKTNDRLVEFVKVIAESKSKFSKEAKNLLGL
jgi:hypothetical protein